MIGLDSNVLVRYLTQDDPIQSPKATEIIERRLTEENPGFVCIVAMAETVWVLDRAYGLAVYEIAAAGVKQAESPEAAMLSDRMLRYGNSQPARRVPR